MYVAKICLKSSPGGSINFILLLLLLLLLLLIIIIIIIIRNLYSAIMPLGGYRGAGGTGR